MSQPHQSCFDEARTVAIEVLGQLAEFWGFTRTMGRVFGMVYLSPEPLSQAQLSDQLGISAASVSLSINGLVRWGAVRKALRAGSRKTCYEAETDFRRIVTSVLKSRERPTLEDAHDAIAHSLDKIQRERAGAGAAVQDSAFLVERLQHLQSVCKLSQRLLQLLLQTGRIDVDAVAQASGHPTRPMADR